MRRKFTTLLNFVGEQQLRIFTGNVPTKRKNKNKKNSDYLKLIFDLLFIYYFVSSLLRIRAGHVVCGILRALRFRLVKATGYV